MANPRRKRFALVRSESVVLPPGGVRRIDFRLPPAPPPGDARLKGFVLRKDDRPVAGACLRLLTRPGDHLVATARSDFRGEFQFPPVAPGTYRLQVTAKGFVDRQVIVFLRSGTRTVTVWLAKAKPRQAVVVGQVTGCDGAPPVVSVTIVLLTDRGKIVGRQRAAPDGEFAFSNLRPGSYRLVATAKGFAPVAVAFFVTADQLASFRLRIISLRN